ncbi:SU10 major capsid protein [Nonomuraea bangladeshensis]|uniref:SU10 major capsid protein n=1 Tax=Nonomuraea bangladeshensis TaxID=404385 RepID=UPI003C2E574D
MAGITGQGDTFDLPNYVGELFAVTPEDTPFLSAIGGLTGGESAEATLFQWQGYDLRDASASRQRLEGADAPTAEARVRFNVNNVVEIHQEALELSYTKLAATGQYASTGSSHAGSVGINGSNPVLNELDWQIQQHLKQIARDVEKSFITGTFNNPSSNATARRTRGILEATATNVSTQGTSVGTAVIEADDESFTISAHGLSNGDAVAVSSLTGGATSVLAENTLYYVISSATNTFKLATKPNGSAIAFSTDGGAVVTKATALTEAIILDLMQDVWTSGGIMESETATLMANATLKRALTKIFITDKNYREMSRTVGGVHVTTIETDFGTLNLMLNRHMPTSLLSVVSLEECTPKFLPIPGKGFLFVEELARSGAAEKRQIYGEIGLAYGNEKKHGKILNVKAA